VPLPSLEAFFFRLHPTTVLGEPEKVFDSPGDPGYTAIMRRLILILILLAAGCTTSDTWTVVRVVDGDTIVARRACGCERRVRLLCIDAPERGQPGYAEAGELLRELIDGKSIRLEVDPAHRDYDRYGRLLRYVWLGGRLINAELVRRGAATYYMKFGKSCYEADFRADF